MKLVLVACILGVVSLGSLVVAGAWNSRQGGSMRNGDSVLVRDFGEDGELGEPAYQDVVVKTDEEWKAQLGPDRHAILRQAGTERAGTGKYESTTDTGFYVCGGCGLPLFHATGKFNSMCGWPSFFRPVSFENIHTRRDISHGMVRTEIVCARCQGHLGHVFEDGPRPTGLRYCVNSASLDFRPAPPRRPASTDTAVFAAGCFWGVEKLFHETSGVVSTRVGYTGGTVEHPTYKQVCTGSTGHAEAVEIVFDPAKIDYARLAELFFLNHDPTTLDRQGPDVGSQYRSAVFFRDADQRAEAERVRDSLVGAGTWPDPVVTVFEPASVFWPAEDYHQGWFLTHPVFCHARRK